MSSSSTSRRAASSRSIKALIRFFEDVEALPQLLPRVGSDRRSVNAGRLHPGVQRAEAGLEMGKRRRKITGRDLRFGLGQSLFR
ncbi:MAG: hypothetical protein R3E12_13950 [Candidatus Eisenbacteria bacterium]